jgi:branched-chain amino acid transport system ATP-binding protein
MLLEVKGLTKHFAGLVAVKDIDFEVQKGQILGLIGPNGAGKTTIFNMISGFLKPTKGGVFFNGQNITGLSPPKICHLGVTRTFQLVKPLSQLTVLENVMVGVFSKVVDAGTARKQAMEVLEFTGQLSQKDVRAGGLPQGDRKRLEISRALATQPDLLLLDECMAGLNPHEISQAIELIGKIRERGVTLIVIEHVMKAIMSVSDQIVVINHGEKIMEGTPNQVVNDREVIKAYLGEDYVRR